MEDDLGPVNGWVDSAQAWIEVQGEEGDWSRRTILDREIDGLLGSVEGLDVLDLGCGEGRFARRLASRGARVTGIDPVPAFVEQARRRDPQGRYLLAGAEALPLADASFDAVVSYLTLIDIPDFRAAIRESARVLRSGGRMAVATLSNYCCTEDPWCRDAAGTKLHRPVADYMTERPVRVAWAGLEVINWHRPLSAVLTAFLVAGFELRAFHEPLPPEDDPLYAHEAFAPNFQTMLWQRR